MKRLVVLNNKNTVVNVVVADDTWEPPKGHSLVEDDNASIGWIYNNGAFINPNKKIDRKLTYQENRTLQYPKIGDQLDAIMKWIASDNAVAVTPELKAIANLCMEVKTKHPKTN